MSDKFDYYKYRDSIIKKPKSFKLRESKPLDPSKMIVIDPKSEETREQQIRR